MEEYDPAFDPNGNDVNDAVDDILTQLSTQNHSITKAKQAEEIPDIEDLEEYLVKKTAKLIDTTLDAVDNVKDYISSAPENRDVASLAELMRSANSAIETMQKIHSNKENNEARKEIKQMDIDSKKELNVMDNTTKLVMSREEIMKALTTDEPVVTDQDKSDAVDID
jgi:4-hydroxy-3-methylbut-2-enyl diphosphate reductase IspH